MAPLAAPRPGLLDLTPEERQAEFDEHGHGAFQRFRRRLPGSGGQRQLPASCSANRSASSCTTRRWPRRSNLATTRWPASGRSSTPATTRPSTATTSRWSTCAGNPCWRSRPTACGSTDEHVDLDVLVLATGFDAMTGALERIDIRGRDGTLLRDDGSTVPAPTWACRSRGSRTCSPSPGPAVPRCWRTSSSPSNSMSSGSPIVSST